MDLMESSRLWFDISFRTCLFTFIDNNEIFRTMAFEIRGGEEGVEVLK